MCWCYYKRVFYQEHLPLSGAGDPGSPIYQNRRERVQESTQAALLGVAYYTGTDFKPGQRVPARQRTHWDTWQHTQ